MQMIFHHEPLLFHEAAELLFLYANQLPMPKFTQKNRFYAIPTADMEQIMSQVCTGLPLEDETLQFFFQQYKLPNGPYTCLARVLSFSFAGMSCATAQQGIENIRIHLKAVREQQLVFENLSTFTLDSQPGRKRADAGIHALAIPIPFRQKLLAVYEDPDGTLAPLARLMEPIMASLSHALLPWTSRAVIMLQNWEDKMREITPERFFVEYLHLEGTPPVEIVQVGALYFAPLWVIYGLENPPPTMTIYVGTGVVPTWYEDATELKGWEYRALHILSNPDRFHMLRAMGEKPMSSREISKELGLHLGTVTRDVNNMNEALLLNVIHQGARRRYSLNYQAIRTLARHLLAMCPEEE